MKTIRDFVNFIGLCFAFLLLTSIIAHAGMGPLKHVQGKHYFLNPSNDEYVYLTGSHTWNNLQDTGETDPPPVFPFDNHLTWLAGYGHNFIRLWVFEQAKGNPYNENIWIEPLQFERTGPGKALDGKLKFNLYLFNQKYFDRLRKRVIKAKEKGIYVSIMLFQGWSIDRTYGKKKNPWKGHPFNKDNNVNDINGDYYNNNGEGEEYHSLLSLKIWELQKAYVRKVIDTVNDLDNVLYEISNEDPGKNLFWADRHKEWQNALVHYIKFYEATKKKQHPVGLTTDSALGNDWIFESNADWISPALLSRSICSDDIYKNNPPVPNVNKVVLLDTDHLWGIGGGRDWVWKAFLRGYNPIYMDNLQNVLINNCKGNKYEYDLSETRRNMGYTLEYAKKIGLTDTIPRMDLSSTQYCLAKEGEKYLIYQPLIGDSVIIRNLQPGKYSLETLDVIDGSIKRHEAIKWSGGDLHLYKPIHVKEDWVAYVRAEN
jgi:hypothetical protein